MKAGEALHWMMDNESTELRAKRTTARFVDNAVEVRRDGYDEWMSYSAIAFIRIHGELTFSYKWSVLSYFQQAISEKPLQLGYAGCLTKG